jgi:hypothetical protein
MFCKSPELAHRLHTFVACVLDRVVEHEMNWFSHLERTCERDLLKGFTGIYWKAGEEGVWTIHQIQGSCTCAHACHHTHTHVHMCTHRIIISVLCCGWCVRYWIVYRHR